MIHCSNPLCQEPNPLDQRYCDRCGRPLTHRYLWAIGDWIKCYQVGEVLESRYLLMAPRILLDLQPDLATYSPMDIPTSILPYLRLFPYRRHLPQIHSYIPSQDDRMSLEIWLLDYGSLPLDEKGQLRYPQLLPAIADCWFQVSARQQLRWLWQMASLWEPLQQQGVAVSLLDPSLLRINGTAVQLLELKQDNVESPGELSQLGEVWSAWVESADPILVPFLQGVCRDLRSQTLPQAPDLLGLLDQALQSLDQAYSQRYRLYTATDIGQLRDHNEDACYPLTESTLEVNAPTPLLTLVCDGVGGQDGGEIAAHLAIETLQTEIEPRLPSWASPSASTSDLKAFLAQAILHTNERIYQRNNSEARQERQRMGTTLVLSVLTGSKAYFAHTGDSRIYWLTPSSCQQVTVDDDWASKEVRLGYSFYRDAIQYPRAGALVQAIGISESSILTPTVESHFLDDNCVILLCSDGLSDYDRVEQYGPALIAPILAGTADVATVGQQLIALANELNGHDNITLSLIHCQSWLPPGTTLPVLDYDQLSAALSGSVPTSNGLEFPRLAVPSASVPLIDPAPEEEAPRQRPLIWLFAIAFSLVAAAIAWVPQLLKPASPPLSPAPMSFPPTAPPPHQ